MPGRRAISVAPYPEISERASITTKGKGTVWLHERPADFCRCSARTPQRWETQGHVLVGVGKSAFGSSSRSGVDAGPAVPSTFTTAEPIAAKPIGEVAAHIRAQPQ